MRWSWRNWSIRHHTPYWIEGNNLKHYLSYLVFADNQMDTIVYNVTAAQMKKWVILTMLSSDYSFIFLFLKFWQTQFLEFSFDFKNRTLGRDTN